MENGEKKLNLGQELLIFIKWCFIFGVIICVAVGAIVFKYIDPDSEVKKYDDVSLYYNNSYDTLNNTTTYNFTTRRCKEFLPDHTFEYGEYVKGFYVFDGSGTYYDTSISFVLELQFEDVQTYQEYLVYENSRHAYTSEFNIFRNGYTCLLSTDSTLTYFYRDKTVPDIFAMFCTNEEQMVVRYVYFNEFENEMDEMFNKLFLNTNCEW